MPVAGSIPAVGSNKMMGGITVQKEAQFAVWKYSTDDENKARWKCSHCGKVCHKNPHDKNYCSNCGCKMRMES